ncbi:Sec63-domain-containing protein [Hygrophoropsis aurantiaca]|uniref:Sec63-domain-containing protein n=1 Tax=Hygrophoropsis aurantiaca TaxID=72124 RepID=A0ACB8AS83_9AGAM|nr:Sec63-domain-containing protein [Hygrophoropsis aurantiaca]
MSDLLNHLSSLISSHSDNLASDHRLARSLEEWLSLRQNSEPLYIEDSGEDYPWPSVLKEFVTASNRNSPVQLALLRKPDVEFWLKPLLTILSSSRPNDEISSEVTDIIGFDDIELVMQLLDQRPSIVKELSTYVESSTPLHPSRKPAKSEDDQILNLVPQEARRRIEETLRENAARPLFSGIAQAAPEILPNVYTSSSIVQGNMLSQFGSKYLLPLGTTRHDYEDYEEVILPPAKIVPPRESERLIPVSELEELAKGSFSGYTSLNRIQSIVYPTAYRSNENMLICAPTGAGKTDVAMLTILRVLDQHRFSISPAMPIRSSIDRNAFKIIYVAPMKALASEIVRKLGKRLQWLSIQVKELTGDMQLTKSEIAETQIIVTTPEKWDVVTRKPTGEGELASKLKLLIIDEVHLLNEERGAVIETIVARTLRQVESSQSVIRIVGLSATLPNYIDVAEFLSVSKYHGLFFFDSSFRPVPLEQHFIGVRGKPGSLQSRKNLDRVTYEKVSDLVRQGHQVMVFVHARKETVKAALALKEAAMTDGTLDEYSCEDHPQWAFFRRSIGESRNKEMKQLFDNGFGIHHAGMLRSDRNMMERMFEARAIKVLCCTATLAWGVNLPAHAVVIKGTQVYDSSKGSFVDLSVLDVLQVFGRAGRPGLETSGEGYICTTEDKLTHYLDAVTSQVAIESQFTTGIVDALNAEISLGTVANANEAVRWLGYTYLFVRMRKNPFQYGMAREVLADDPQLGQRRNELVTAAAKRLADARMIIFNQTSGTFTITDLGRIAAKYYIRHQSVEIFNSTFKPKMTEADVLGMLSKSTEFDQIQVRESEIKELEILMKACPCDVRGGTDTSYGKVNILLQAYISRLHVEDFALVSDTAYSAQNGGRIIRALLEIAISRKWASVTAALMGMSKAIEKRLWPFNEPLRQFDLRADIIYGLETSGYEYSPAEIASMTAVELGELVRMNERHGQALRNAAKQFPTVQITYSLRPLGADVLKIAVTVTRAFNWSSKHHGSAEPFWLWVEDHHETTILQYTHLLFRENTKALDVDFVVSIPNGNPPPFVTIRFVSDRWMGAEDELTVSLKDLIMPTMSHNHTPRLDLPFLRRSAIRLPVLEDLYMTHLHEFNAVQTQIFWSVVNAQVNALVAAPVSCGKSLIGHISLWTTVLRPNSRSWALLISPSRSVAMSTISDLRPIASAVGVSVEFASGPHIMASCTGKTIRVVTAENLFAFLRRRDINKSVNYPSLVVCENLEQLDSVYELGIALLRHATQHSPTRFIGFSSSLNDPTDLAGWLDVDPLALHSFRPSERDQSLTVSTQTFTVQHSAALFKTMAKPACAAIRTASSDGSAIIFVPSRGQCRAVARDLLTQCALDMESERGFLSETISPHYIEDFCARLQDQTLIDSVSRGVGIFHSGVSKPDRNLILELYAEGIVRVLIVPHDACWAVPVRAAVVIVMSTQYVYMEGVGAERQMRDYSLVELVQMQGRAVQHSTPGYFFLFCQAEALDTFTRFLNEGLPLESQLLESKELESWYRERREDGTLPNKQAGMEALSFTFLARRVVSNPAYYDTSSSSREDVLSRIVDRLEETRI